MRCLALTIGVGLCIKFVEGLCIIYASRFLEQENGPVVLDSMKFSVVRAGLSSQRGTKLLNNVWLTLIKADNAAGGAEASMKMLVEERML